MHNIEPLNTFSLPPFILLVTDGIHKTRIETAVLPPNKMPQSLLTSDGLLSPPEPNNANDVDENMGISTKAQTRMNSSASSYKKQSHPSVPAVS